MGGMLASTLGNGLSQSITYDFAGDELSRSLKQGNTEVFGETVLRMQQASGGAPPCGGSATTPIMPVASCSLMGCREAGCPRRIKIPGTAIPMMAPAGVNPISIRPMAMTGTEPSAIPMAISQRQSDRHRNRRAEREGAGRHDRAQIWNAFCRRGVSAPDPEDCSGGGHLHELQPVGRRSADERHAGIGKRCHSGYDSSNLYGDVGQISSAAKATAWRSPVMRIHGR